MTSLLVVGNGLAGLSAVRAAREVGFTGTVQVLGAEAGRPYDRPPLSKDYLAGRSGPADLGLESAREELGAEWLVGSAAVLDPDRGVVTGDGRVLRADGVVLATGARARTLAHLPHASENILVLRTRDDADRLRAELVPGRHLVVVGAGLIGCEVAATASERGCRVTVLTPEDAPLAAVYGSLAPRLLDLHARRGVVLRGGVSVVGVGVEGGRATSVRLGDGEEIAADVVLVAVGAQPETDWLSGSGLDLGDGVLCDQAGRVLADGAPVPGLVAVGDCAAWWDPHLGRHHRTQHWTDAAERPGRAVAALLGVPAPARKPYLPYFWSDQHGHRIQMAGYASLADSVDVETDAGEQGFLAVYRRAGEPVAALSLDRPREFVRWRKSLVASLGQRAETPAADTPAGDIPAADIPARGAAA